MSTLFRFLDRMLGRFVCNRLGSHTPDWTFAHMFGGEPICRFCKRTRSSW